MENSNSTFYRLEVLRQHVRASCAYAIQVYGFIFSTSSPQFIHNTNNGKSTPLMGRTNPEAVSQIKKTVFLINVKGENIIR